MGKKPGPVFALKSISWTGLEAGQKYETKAWFEYGRGKKILVGDKKHNTYKEEISGNSYTHANINVSGPMPEEGKKYKDLVVQIWGKKKIAEVKFDKDIWTTQKQLEGTKDGKICKLACTFNLTQEEVDSSSSDGLGGAPTSTSSSDA